MAIAIVGCSINKFFLQFILFLHNQNQLESSIMDKIQDDDFGRDMVQVHLIFSLPKDRRLTNLSLSYPDLKIFILSLIPLSAPKGLALLQVNGPKIDEFLAEVARLYPGSTHSILGKQEPQVLLSLELADPWILNQLIKIEMNAHYPIPVQAGKMQLELIAPRNKIDELMNQFESANLDVTLNRIGRVHLKPILTPQQEKLILHAKDWGYFEIPRRINLHEFASKEGISASALSENLRRISNKLIKEYLHTNFFITL